MKIANLVKHICLIRYPWPVEITHGRGGEFLGHEFKNILIENEYGIKTKPYSPRNPHVNTIIYIVHKLLGNLVKKYNIHEIYVEDSEPRMAILSADAF